jgi:hypothetical protein
MLKKWTLSGGAIVSVLMPGCGSDSSSSVSTEPSETIAATAAVTTTTNAIRDPPPTSTGPPPAMSRVPPQVTELYECWTSHGIGLPDPSQPIPSPAPAVTYSPEVAVEAWNECRDIYLAVMRESLTQHNQIEAPLPSAANPLAYAECMATYGWVTIGQYAPMDELADYTAANAACRLPVEGESREASYCRFLNAIFDRAMHDRSVSVTGTPYEGDNETRRAAAVALYDEALTIAPDMMVEDLTTLRDSFLNGTPMSNELWDRMIDYHLGICGAWVYLGSLD